MAKVIDKNNPLGRVSKDNFRKELQEIVKQKLVEINHYVSGCDSPFSYLQIADVQECLREIEKILGIEEAK